MNKQTKQLVQIVIVYLSMILGLHIVANTNMYVTDFFFVCRFTLILLFLVQNHSRNFYAR